MDNSISSAELNPHADFLLTSRDFTESEAALTNKWMSYEDFIKIEDFPAEVKTIWAKISIENTSSDSEFFISSTDYIPNLIVFELRNGITNKTAQTGFRISADSLSIKKDIQSARIKLSPGERKIFLLKVDSYKNELLFNNLKILKKEDYLNQHNFLTQNLVQESSPLIFLFIGIHFCLFILAISRFRAIYFRKSIFIFIFINLFYIIFYSTDYNYLNLENRFLPNVTNDDYVNFMGAMEPALYYVFFWSYLDQHKLFRRIILFSGLFWVFFYFLTNIEWSSSMMIAWSRFVRNFGPIYDLLVTTSVFIFLLKYKSTFHRYARLGVFILLLSAIQLSFPFITGLFGYSSKTPRFIDDNSYFIMYTAIVLDFMLFLYGQNKNEVEILAQKEQLEKQFLKSELDHQKSLLDERKRISHDMHDDIGAGISSMKLQAEFLKQKVKDSGLMEDINDLLKTSDEMNQSMREMIWSLNSDNDDLLNFIQYASIYAENFFRKTEIKLHINSDVLHKIPVYAESRRNLFLALKEALNNVYKHSSAKNVWLNFSSDSSLFTIDITDDGVGMKVDAKLGNGLKSMKNRMTKVNGFCKIIQNEVGLQVQLTVDLSNRL